MAYAWCTHDTIYVIMNALTIVYVIGLSIYVGLYGSSITGHGVGRRVPKAKKASELYGTIPDGRSFGSAEKPDITLSGKDVTQVTPNTSA